MKIPHQSIVYGTVVLTGISFLCRGIGFFYRIFISQTFGEEGMGIFQLTSPVMSLAYSLCCAGFQTAISRFVAARPDKPRESLRFLCVGLSITGILSFIFSFFIYESSDFLAVKIILEPRTAPLLRLLALSFPFSAIHCCMNGYYYGKKKAEIPAFLQLLEQLGRVGSVYIISNYYLSRENTVPLAVTAAGSAIAEFLSACISLCFILPHFSKVQSQKQRKLPLQRNNLLSYRKTSTSLLSMAIPLSTSRIVVNLLQSVENIYIPESLRAYGYTTQEALSLFGVLTGMALTVIFLPCSLVNSVSVLLLPRVSEAQARNQEKVIALVIKRCVTFCCVLGFLCTLVFYFGGHMAGELLFHSETAGNYIISLSFISPFLYITSSLGSVLHGLGKTYSTLFINIGALCIRIASVLFLVPRLGISGYICGLLAGQCFAALCCIFSLRKYALY